MIGMLLGKIIDKSEPGRITIDVAGVGYEVETSLTTFFNLEMQEDFVKVYIHTIVREDAFLLYGFADKEERILFRSLIKVNGVGPKLAIAILSSILPHDFVQCIQSQDAAMLTKLPGIGRKTAERLVVEMKDSINKIALADPKITSAASNQNIVDEAISALEALGFKPQEAKKAIDGINDGGKTAEQLIREGLRLLSVH